MAVFGLPGGFELLMLLAIAVMLFVPGAGFVWIGYLLGRRRTEVERAADVVREIPPVYGGPRQGDPVAGRAVEDAVGEEPEDADE